MKSQELLPGDAVALHLFQDRIGELVDLLGRSRPRGAFDPGEGMAHVLLRQPGRMTLDLETEITLLEQHRLAIAAQQRIAQPRLEPVPAGRERAGDIAAILVVHAQHGAEPVRLHALARTLEPVFSHAVPVDPLLPIQSTDAEIRAGLLRIWQVMQDCVRRGFEAQGLLPGVLGVRRRAPKLYRQLMSGDPQGPMHALDWVNVFALAVNEENAAGGQVVTAPTNGAAGIVPAVLHYYRRFEPGADDAGVIRFLLTAAAIGMLYKQNASISGAEMGCQGEVGVACSMAAAGLVSALNGSNEQIENAAEIGMEHNLGLTCDPVAGLVQIPCIERNAMGSVKAINAARLAMRGDGSHKVSLDQVIATMRQTGLDMSTIYKETSQGGLAVNVPEC